MTKKEEKIIKQMKLHATHNNGITLIQGEIPTALYNSIMSSTTKTRKPSKPRTSNPPAWAVNMQATMTSILATQVAQGNQLTSLDNRVAAQGNQLNALTIDVAEIRKIQTEDHELLMKMANTPTMKKELAELDK